MNSKEENSSDFCPNYVKNSASVFAHNMKLRYIHKHLSCSSAHGASFPLFLPITQNYEPDFSILA